jgi:hypothetical protein
MDESGCIQRPRIGDMRVFRVSSCLERQPSKDIELSLYSKVDL